MTFFGEECVSVGHASTLSVSIPHAGWDWRGAAARDTGVRCHRGRTLALARNALRLPMGRDIAGKIFIADWTSALRAKALDRLLSHYAADVTVFDVKPLFQTTGAAAWRATWEACLSYFPVFLSDGGAGMSVLSPVGMSRSPTDSGVTGMAKDHPAMQMWMRATVGSQRLWYGRWQIVPETSQAAFALEP